MTDIMIRVFYGIPIDRATAEQLQQGIKSQLQAIDEENIRWMNSEFWHITVKFFAKISPESLDLISKQLKQITNNTKSFNLKIKKINKFPNPGSKVVAAHVKPKRALREMHKFLDKLGGDMGIKPECRRYKPHITLAKFSSNRYSIEPVKYTGFYLPVREIVLYESRPTDKGSYYIPLRRFELLK